VNFFDRQIFHFSIGKSAINAPRLWKDCLIDNRVCYGFSNCKWKMTIQKVDVQHFLSTFPAYLIVFLLSVLHVYKLSSALEKADTSVAYRFCSTFDKGAIKFRLHHPNWFPTWRLKTRRRSKRLSEDGGQAKFSENLRASPLINIYQLRPLLACSILLDSTFK
jgi:hypothetical protein